MIQSLPPQKNNQTNDLENIFLKKITTTSNERKKYEIKKSLANQKNIHKKSILQFSLHLLKKYPELAKKLFSTVETTNQLWKLFTYSPALSHFFMKDPAYFSDLFQVNSSAETIDQFHQDLTSRLETIVPNTDPNQILKILRQTKIRSYLKIALSDWEEKDSFETTTSKISIFAEVLLKKVFVITQLSQHSIAAISMGKLGGEELNYQSDIDLTFVIADSLSSQHDEFIEIEKKIKQLIHYFQTFTEDGMIFKVDMQIRPEGASGLPFLTMKQYHHYYHHRAQEWELQALIKARWIAGDRELGKQFMAFKKEFVFQNKYRTGQMLLQISEMKNKIETHFKETNFENVKLGPGGIRDIEFIAQFLQIVHGKLSPSLNDGNTISTLKTLWNYQAISTQEYQYLYNHYCFLRKIEHYLQLYELRAIRKIPQDQKILTQLTQLLKGKHLDQKEFPFKNIEHFLEYHHSLRILNCELFEQLFYITNDFSNKIALIYQKIMDRHQREEILDRHIQNLESDYFLAFESNEIINHIETIDHMNSQNSTTTQIQILPVNKKHHLKINIFTRDKFGVFSLISGLISSYQINILSGASFIYNFTPLQEKSTLKNIFKNKIFLKKKNYPQLSKKNPPLIICSMEIEVFSEFFFSNPSNFLTKLKNDLISHCDALSSSNYDRLMEEISIKIIDLIKEEDQPNYLKPIHIQITNDSHSLYTVLEIESEDAFMFLYHFTQAIATRNFYLVKIEFNTKNNLIYNRLFLTDQFKDKIKATKQLEELKSTILIIKYFSYYLIKAPNPQLALKQFVKIINEFSQDYEQTFSDLLNHGHWFKELATILGTTETFFEDFIRSQSNHIKKYLHTKKEIDQSIEPSYLKIKINQQLNSTDDWEEKIIRLNQFKDELLFQIDVRWLSHRISDFRDFCNEISLLTDIVMQSAYRIISENIKKKFNWTEFKDQAAFLALGKWGAREMGYASDVELIFVYDPQTTNHQNETLEKIKKYYEEIAILIPQVIKSKKNGIFEIDMRLRPHQESSSWAISLEKFKKYYLEKKLANQFERLSLSRMRIIDILPTTNLNTLNEKIISIRDQFVYSDEPIDLENFHHLKKRQQTELCPTGKINIKFSSGGIVDVEYLIQYLIIIHGHKEPALRVTSTFLGITQLKKYQILTDNHANLLTKHYLFLRGIIDCLRIVRGNAKDLLLPNQNDLEMVYLKRRAINFQIIKREENLTERINQSMATIIDIQKNYLK